MACQRCNSKRILRASGKTSDMAHCYIGGVEHDGYVPCDLGIGGGDYIRLGVCLDCGQMQGTFPLPLSAIERGDLVEDE